MAFYSQKDFLSNTLASPSQMQLKDTAPPLTRSASPTKLPLKLADIPEATPGPNAFAQHAALRDQFRMQGNAFCQEELRRRNITPFAVMHPALRGRSSSDPPTPPRPAYPFAADSASSAFRNPPPATVLPLMNLLPSGHPDAVPTRRAEIEGRREKRYYDSIDPSEIEEGIPVYEPTPKLASQEFASSPSKSGFDAVKDPKTPRKKLMQKFRLIGNKTNAGVAPSSSQPLPVYITEGGGGCSDVPVKARAVLGTASPVKSRTSLGSSPSKSILPRSPSKRKGFFSRKSSTLLDGSTALKTTAEEPTLTADHPPRSSSAVAKTPQTAVSDPTHYSYDGFGGKTTVISEHGIGRSQSLKYFDHIAPPTPPAKNTPPKEKENNNPRSTQQKSSRVPFNETSVPEPTRGMLSTNDRISPTRFGNYGRREAPRLITQPSMYSLHASVVPNLSDATTFEEMKARVDGLGLEGFSMPAENVYSPSIYSNEWTSPRTRFVPRGSPMPCLDMASSSKGFARVSQPVNRHTEEHSSSSSSRESVPIVYPDLAKDPSASNLTRLVSSLSDGTTWDGMKNAAGHRDTLRNDEGELRYSSILDHYADVRGTPTSYSQKSAMVSPLQYLPATVYTPSSKDQKGDKAQPVSADKPTTTSGLGIRSRGAQVSDTPSRRAREGTGTASRDIFHSAPHFPPFSSAPTGTTTPFPSPSPSSQALPSTPFTTDPQKPSSSHLCPSSLSTSPSSTSDDKLDRMMEMLRGLQSQANPHPELLSIRDELRASTAQLNERLSAVEGSKRVTEDEMEEAPTGREQKKRIATCAAREFYRMSNTSATTSTANSAGSAAPEGNESMEELRETNRRLVRLMDGFACKIQALERKFDGGD